jgi:hypothetical protein
MGWWKTSGAEGVVGDEPLDVLGGAAAKVVKQYEAAFGRRPTIAEWEVLLQTVLGVDKPEYRCMEDGVAADVRITPRT